MGVCGIAFGINDGNIAIGQAEQNSIADDFAFVWTPTIGLRRLPPIQNAPGNVEFDQPSIINAQNQILGTAQVQDSTGRAIASFNVMWTLPPGYGRQLPVACWQMRSSSIPARSAFTAPYCFFAHFSSMRCSTNLTGLRSRGTRTTATGVSIMK
jgi:hypothetical protein